MQQLCAASHWSKSIASPKSQDLESGANEGFEPWTNAEKGRGEWKDWWNFVQCMNYGRRDEVGKDSLAKSCAKVVGRGQFPVRLLLANFAAGLTRPVIWILWRTRVDERTRRVLE